MPPPVWERDHAGHEVVVDLDGDAEAAHPGGNFRKGAGFDAAPGRVFGVHLQSAPIPTCHEALDVVHPGIVRPQMPATNQQETLGLTFLQEAVHPVQFGED